MFVKIFTQILDSSLADNRKLRHFFMDLLLCSDADGNVLMTAKAIALRIRATADEVQWGLQELQKPDPESKTVENEGRRIAPLEGHGYGWKILNYEMYRDIKSDQQRRAETAERVRKWRERKKAKSPSGPLRGETAYVKASNNGASQEQLDQMASQGLPARENIVFEGDES